MSEPVVTVGLPPEPGFSILPYPDDSRDEKVSILPFPHIPGPEEPVISILPVETGAPTI